ncbi:hypothetical protein BDV59DRAFT_187520 [Aspergillus ambiguus]|uniref:uncharacterized protein n=1 Tax=Aspergillus ambiguus TaxID=176160 RepID=UPI003CCCF29E
MRARLEGILSVAAATAYCSPGPNDNWPPPPIPLRVSLLGAGLLISICWGPERGRGNLAFAFPACGGGFRHLFTPSSPSDGGVDMDTSTCAVKAQ